MGMKSGHPRQALLAFVEGRLDAAGRARVERHLPDCAACRAEVAELIHVTDTIGALPAALGGLAQRPAGSWSAIWARVRAVPVRPLSVAPQLNLTLSLAVVVFVLAASLPAGLGARPASVTAGAIQTPVAAHATPSAGRGTAAGAAQLSTALAANRLAAGARAIPVPTPVPGLKG
jgi:anti-sigma factor RsiW